MRRQCEAKRERRFNRFAHHGHAVEQAEHIGDPLLWRDNGVRIVADLAAASPRRALRAHTRPDIST